MNSCNSNSYNNLKYHLNRTSSWASWNSNIVRSELFLIRILGFECFYILECLEVLKLLVVRKLKGSAPVWHFVRERNVIRSYPTLRSRKARYPFVSAIQSVKGTLSVRIRHLVREMHVTRSYPQRSCSKARYPFVSVTLFVKGTISVRVCHLVCERHVIRSYPLRQL